MKRCPHCDTENADTSTYCERCGTLLPDSLHYSSEREYTTSSPRKFNLPLAEYIIPSQSDFVLPMSNHTVPHPPSSAYMNYSSSTAPPQVALEEQISPRTNIG